MGGAGAIDEVRVWKIARTQAEIQAASLTQLAGTEPGLVGYWNFDNSAPNPSLELDSSLTSNTIFVGWSVAETTTRINNAAPQLGYMDVNVDREVTNALGLWVHYSVSRNSARPDVDFYSAKFRKVSNDPRTEEYGIIIPKGERSGRIYFMEKSDAIFEPTETITVALQSYSFLNDDRVTNTATINIRLTSQPEQPISVYVNGNAKIVFLEGDVEKDFIEFTVNPEDWDKAKTLTLRYLGSPYTERTYSFQIFDRHRTIPERTLFVTDFPPSEVRVEE